MNYASSVSSATLSLETIDNDIPPSNTAVSSSISSIPSASRPTYRLVVTAHKSLPYKYYPPGNEYGPSTSIHAAATPESRYLEEVLSNGYTKYCTLLRAIILERHRRTGRKMFREWVEEMIELEGLIKKNECEFSPQALRIFRYGDMGITTPLMEAIRANLPENVALLLKFGADPNGIPHGVVDQYAALFLRFRPAIPPIDEGAWDVASRAEFMEQMNLVQTSALTVEEIEDRYWDGMAPFWCEQGFTPANTWHHGDSMPSLVEAAKSGSIELFQQLEEAGAERSFWIDSSETSGPCYFPSISSLSVSSPIHAAIRSNEMKMLTHLLDSGFDPNIMPLANPTRCITPLMATIIYHEEFNKAAFDILCSYGAIIPSVRTPVYGVHLLHFAVASLNLDTIKHIAAIIPLEDAGKTSLEHSLLHIACMPANAKAVQRHSEAIYHSIHETRDLNPQNDPHASLPPPGDLFNTTVFEDDFVPHTEVVKYLWSNGIKGIHDRDVHGNTPLHYLVGHRDVNQVLLTWLLEQQGVYKVWHESKNRYGYTAQELFRSGKYARIVLGEDTPKPWFERKYSKDRWVQKQNIWRELLGKQAWREM